MIVVPLSHFIMDLLFVAFQYLGFVDDMGFVGLEPLRQLRVRLMDSLMDGDGEKISEAEAGGEIDVSVDSSDFFCCFESEGLPFFVNGGAMFLLVDNIP